MPLPRAMDDFSRASARLRAAVQTATTGLVGREQLAELMILAAVAREHLLVIGPPGTAKSAVVRRVASTMGGRYFEYLLGRFTEPSELFGPVDLRLLREGRVESDVTGMLPEADVAFLDEVFLGSTAVLNTLLGVLNERRYRRGHTDLACPLRICVGAANALPEDDALAAFADRFALRLFVEPVPDSALEALLEGGWQSEQAPAHIDAHTGVALADLDLLAARVPSVRLEAVRGTLADAVRTLRRAGQHLSDRRIVRSQRLVAAAAVLAGREVATDADLWPLFYMLPTAQAQSAAREALRGTLAIAANPTLRGAVEQAALQPVSRADRLVQAARSCLREGGTANGADEATSRTLAEALLREIDANFAADALPPELAAERSRLVDHVQPA